MADDKDRRGPRDRERIDVNEDYELRYWSEKFGVSRDDLQQAVQRVGNKAADVERALSRK